MCDRYNYGGVLQMKKRFKQVKEIIIYTFAIIGALFLLFSTVSWEYNTKIVYEGLSENEINLVEKYILADLKPDMKIGIQKIVFTKYKKSNILGKLGDRGGSGMYNPFRRIAYIKLPENFYDVSISTYKETTCHELLHYWVGILHWKHKFIGSIDKINEVCYYE